MKKIMPVLPVLIRIISDIILVILIYIIFTFTLFRWDESLNTGIRLVFVWVVIVFLADIIYGLISKLIKKLIFKK